MRPISCYVFKFDKDFKTIDWINQVTSNCLQVTICFGNFSKGNVSARKLNIVLYSLYSLYLMMFKDEYKNCRWNRKYKKILNSKFQSLLRISIVHWLGDENWEYCWNFFHSLGNWILNFDYDSIYAYLVI